MNPRLSTVVTFLLGTLALGATAAAGPPKVGDRAPDFKLPGTDGKQYTLKQFTGKSAVALVCFVKAMSVGCTIQCDSVKREMGTLSRYRIEVFGLSVDPPERNREFAQRNGFPFPLLSDPEKTYARALGVLHPSGEFARRWTYVIDEQGVIRHIDTDVVPKTHGYDLGVRLKALGIPLRK